MRAGQCDCPEPEPDNGVVAAGFPLEVPLSLQQWRKNNLAVAWHCAHPAQIGSIVPHKAILISFDVTALLIVLIWMRGLSRQITICEGNLQFEAFLDRDRSTPSGNLHRRSGHLPVQWLVTNAKMTQGRKSPFYKRWNQTSFPRSEMPESSHIKS